jgi:hypothetical protein
LAGKNADNCLNDEGQENKRKTRTQAEIESFMINNSYAWMGGQWWIWAVLAVLVVVVVVIKKLFRRK